MGIGRVAQVVYTLAKGITRPLLSVKTDRCTLVLVAERVICKGASAILSYRGLEVKIPLGAAA